MSNHHLPFLLYLVFIFGRENLLWAKCIPTISQNGEMVSYFIREATPHLGPLAKGGHVTPLNLSFAEDNSPTLRTGLSTGVCTDQTQRLDDYLFCLDSWRVKHLENIQNFSRAFLALNVENNFHLPQDVKAPGYSQLLEQSLRALRVQCKQNKNCSDLDTIEANAWGRYYETQNYLSINRWIDETLIANDLSRNTLVRGCSKEHEEDIQRVQEIQNKCIKEIEQFGQTCGSASFSGVELQNDMARVALLSYPQILRVAAIEGMVNSVHQHVGKTIKRDRYH